MSEGFRKAGILVAARDEVVSLRETIEGLQAACDPADVGRIGICLAPHATRECIAEAYRLAAQNFPIPVLAGQEQGDMGTGLEMQQLFRTQVDLSHALIWTADQDAPAEHAAKMIAKAKEHPAAVVKLSRFIPGGSLPAEKKGFINFRDKMFAQLVRWFWNMKQTDPHFGLVLFPMEPFLRFNLREPFMSFTIEYVLSFERLGAEFVEIPLKQQVRTEGESNMKVHNKLRYFVPVIRLRFCAKHKIFKP